MIDSSVPPRVKATARRFFRMAALRMRAPAPLLPLLP
jgi:hypothetical protein